VVLAVRFLATKNLRLPQRQFYYDCALRRILTEQVISIAPGIYLMTAPKNGISFRGWWRAVTFNERYHSYLKIIAFNHVGGKVYTLPPVDMTAI
jgi:hypothetical protein